MTAIIRIDLDDQIIKGGYSDIVFMKLDQNGNKLSTQFYGTPDYDYLWDFNIKDTGEIISINSRATGTKQRYTGYYQNWIYYFSTTSIQYFFGLDCNKIYNIIPTNMFFRGLKTSKDGSIYLVDYATRTLYKLNNMGGIIWETKFINVGGVEKSIQGFYIDENDSFIYITGLVKFSGRSDSDIFIVKMAPDGTIQ